MIISKKYAQKLVREGKATIEGRTTDQPRWEDRHTGKTYVIVTRHDKQRTDHYEEV
jgi:hypothetical protein